MMRTLATFCKIFCLILLLGVSVLVLNSCSSNSQGSSKSGSSAGVNGAASKNGLSEQERADARKGAILFIQLGCNTCHMNPTTGKNYPDLRGIYGRKVRFKDGSTAIVNDEYLKESILQPNKKILAGYEPAMPNFSHLKEEQVRQLIAYIKSLKNQKPQFEKPESFAE